MKIGLATGVALAIACAAGSADAQFTAAVVPPKQVVQPDTTTRRDSAHKARVALQARMSDMKAWVDSVSLALASTPESTRAESATAGTRPARPESTVVSSGEVAPAETTAAFHAGAPAPATATPLPMFALAGAVLVCAGALLLRR